MKFIGSDRLQYRLWGAFVLVLLIPVGIISYYHLTVFSASLREDIRLNATQLSASRTAEVETALQQGTADLLFLTGSSELRSYANATQEAERPRSLHEVETLFMNFLTRSGRLYESACVLNALGMETLCVDLTNGDTVRRTQVGLSDQIDSAHFNGAISLSGIGGDQPLVYISEVDLHQRAGEILQPYEPVLRYATRLQTDTGVIVGVMALEMRLRPLMAILADEDATTYVVDAHGDYLLHPNRGELYGSLLGTGHNLNNHWPQDAARLLSQPRGVWFGTRNQPDKLISFNRVAPRAQRTQWTVIYRQPLSNVMQPVNNARRTTLGLAFLLLLLTSAFAFWVAGRITAPLVALTRTAASLQAGRWDTAIKPHYRQGEIGQLTRAFSHMRDHIRELVERLQHRVQELEQVQAELRRSEGKYRAFIQQADEGIHFSDPQGIIQEWNRSCERITGIPAKEALGQPITEIERRLMSAPQHNAVLSEAESRIRRADDGSLRYVENTVFTIQTDSGTFSGGLIRDISEQEAAEARVASQLQQLAAFQEIAIAIGGAFQLSRVLAVMLQQLERLIPYDRATIMLVNDEGLQTYKSFGFPSAYDFSPYEQRALQNTDWKEKYDLQYGQATIIPDVQQDPRWVNLMPLDQQTHAWLGVPLIHRDVLLGVLNLDHDTAGHFTQDHAQLAYAVAQQAAIAIATAQVFENMEQLVSQRTHELQLEKERSETILTHIADAIVFTDLQGHILFANPAWEQLNGYRLANVLGQQTNLLKSGQTPTEVYKALWGAINAGEIWRGDLTNRRKDGSTYQAELTIVPVHAPDGRVQNVIGVQRDVTERRALEALKEQFIADAAHDLGNPVAVLNTSLYLLKRSPAQLEKRLPVLEYQVQRLDNLVRDLLTISRLDRGVSLSEVAQVNLDYVMRYTVEAQQALAQQKQITLAADISQVPPILGDVGELERVVVNLLANALNYTPPGGIVAVRLRAEDALLYLDIEDTGIGIPLHEQARVFDRFFRSDKARQTADGTGLGLPIVKAIVQKYHGEIHLHSVPGEGTRFTVHFPLQPPPTDESDSITP